MKPNINKFTNYVVRKKEFVAGNKYYFEKIQSIFKGKTNNTLLQLFRYTFVGGLLL